MATDARNDLNERLRELLQRERERYYPVTDPLLEGTTADDLTTATNAARAAVAERFPELAGTPRVIEKPRPNAASSLEESASSGPLRDLFAQLRGGFRGGDDGSV